jgi:lipopolysaccharide/colanic/teichoic acid biosynthesis glycosyltransferase
MRLGNEELSSLGGDRVGVCRNAEGYEGANLAVPAWKRFLDIACVAIALPFLLPVMVAIAALIKCASRGPVLFLQERVGLRGRRFICFKFRTMKANADVGVHQRYLAELMQSDKPMLKMDAKCDPRLIPFGSILRSTGLDELPQILNVLGGQMSLVGPRPCLPYEYENYEPAQRRRFDTLPGLTGLWQVSGKNRTTFSEMIALDVRYAREKSAWLDLKIMFKTIPALVSQVLDTRRRRRQHRVQSTIIPAAPVYAGNLRESVEVLAQK